MGTKGINTAEMDFLYARRRVQKKSGEKKTGKVPPITPLANPRGGLATGERRARCCPPQPSRLLATVLALASGERRMARFLLVLASDESAPQAHGAGLLHALLALLVTSPRV